MLELAMKHMLILLLASFQCCTVLAFFSKKSSKWTVVSKQSSSSAGSATQPSVRYGHKCLPYEGNIICSHGYFFDRDSGVATWKSDSWAMQTQKPFHWSLLTKQLSQEHSHSQYSSGRMPHQPCGRFGFGLAAVNETLYLYGGHDGGISRHNQQNYEPGYDFEELWRYDILSGAWAYLPLPADAPSPGKRYLAALTAISHTLLLYGGLQEGQGDVWAYYTMAGRWELLHEDRPMGPSSPGRRMGHSIIPFETPKARGFLLYGGRSVGADDKPVVHADVWFFDLDARAWREVHPDGEPMPEGRTYHALFETLVPTSAGEAVHVAVAAGGTTTTPRLSCASDAWLFVVDCEARSVSWKKLPDMPVALYDLAGAAYGKDAFLHGGHLCSLDDTKTFPYYYTNLAVHLDLSQHLPAAGAGCVVKHAPKHNYVKLASLTSTDL